MIPQTKFLSLLDKTFLSEIISEPIRKFSLSTGSKQGDNVASSLIAVDIETNTGAIHHIVVKTPPYDNLAQLTYVKKWRIFDIENNFYHFVAPKLQSLLEKSQNCKIRKLNIPTYFFGSSDLLVLGDLRPLGYKMADKFQGLNLGQVNLVMAKLGQFHSLTYTLIREEGEQIFEEKSDCLNHLFLNSIIVNKLDPDPSSRQKLRECFRKMYEKSCYILGERTEELSKKMLKLAPIADKLMLLPYDKTDVSYFPVISHGDFWSNNCLFLYDNDHGLDERQPKDVIFLDFQQTRRDSIFYDLLYFFFTSTTPEFRRDNLISSLSVYFDGFVDTLRNLGKPLPLNFTRGWLVDQFFENIPNIFAYMNFAIPLQLGDYGKLGCKIPPAVEKLADDGLLTLEDRIKYMVWKTSNLLECSPAALNRLEAVALEIDHLGIFDQF